MSNGGVIDNPKNILKYSKDLAKAQKHLSRKKHDSASYNKQRLKVARLQEKISNSRKGNSIDDGLMENFFGLLKTEVYYDQEDEYKTIDDLIKAIEDYIYYYNNDRIKSR